MPVAITRGVSPAMADCELSHLEREPIDVARAAAQHAAYEKALAVAGCRVRQLPADRDLPDSVFVEDAAVVLDEVAVITRPGAPSRRRETESLAEALRPYRRLLRLAPPATLDGGDVLVAERTIWLGRSARTNDAGIEAFRRAVGVYGYRFRVVPVEHCLHLKSAVTRVADDLLLLQPQWIDPEAFEGWRTIETGPGEPFAANALRIGDAVIHASAHPRTGERLERAGLRLIPIDVSELAKAEGGLTCCSLVFSP